MPCHFCGMNDRGLTDTQRIWLTDVEACTAGGGSMKGYAAEHGLDLQRFYLWKGWLKKLGGVAERQGLTPSPPTFVPVPFAPSRQAPSGLMKRVGTPTGDFDQDELHAYFDKIDVFELWRQLSLLPKTYKDVWREWFLPTALGEMTSAP